METETEKVWARIERNSDKEGLELPPSVDHSGLDTVHHVRTLLNDPNYKKEIQNALRMWRKVTINLLEHMAHEEIWHQIETSSPATEISETYVSEIPLPTYISSVRQQLKKGDFKGRSSEIEQALRKWRERTLELLKQGI